MTKKIFSILLFLGIPQITWSQNIFYDDSYFTATHFSNVSTQQNYFNQQDFFNDFSLLNTSFRISNLTNGYSESKARRAEVVFLISLPFSLLLNIGATALVYHAATGNTNLSAAAWAFAGSSAVLFSGAIAWHDYRTVFGKNLPDEKPRMEFRYSALLTH